MNLRLTKKILVAISPAVFILFTACGGGGDDKLVNQPAPAVVTLNCPNGVAGAAASATNPAGIPGALQLAQIPNQLPSVNPGPQQITIQPNGTNLAAQSQSLNCAEHPDDKASREALQNQVRQAATVCGDAYASNAASLVPLALLAPDPSQAAQAITVVPGSTPVNQSAASQCQTLIKNIDDNFRTMGGGRYQAQPGAKEWLVANLGQGIIQKIASQSGVNPAVAMQPANQAKLRAAGQAYYQSRIAPVLGSTSFGQAASTRIAAF